MTNLRESAKRGESLWQQAGNTNIQAAYKAYGCLEEAALHACDVLDLHDDDNACYWDVLTYLEETRPDLTAFP